MLLFSDPVQCSPVTTLEDTLSNLRTPLLRTRPRSMGVHPTLGSGTSRQNSWDIPGKKLVWKGQNELSSEGLDFSTLTPLRGRNHATKRSPDLTGNLCALSWGTSQ